ncbi:dihydrofolate reductase [Marinicellulosiphila megalodicopiae]|uniref:dihydrofolate reductase n=1 Tax=Marinicellulosiphila megalodicopiae TaxID=2724896 RepID=UPI003BB21DBC
MNHQITVSLIWAMSSNRCIGVNNTLPWHLPEDLRYFKTSTMKKPIIMGRKTYDSIGRALPGRPNIVISRQENLKIEGVHCVNSIDSALTLAQKLMPEGFNEVMIIGGAQIYNEALSFADRLYITEVDTIIEGDAFIEEFDISQFEQTFCEKHKACEKNPYDYSFLVFDKKGEK